MMKERERQEKVESLIQALQATYLDFLSEEPDAGRTEIIERLRRAYRELCGEDLKPEMVQYLCKFAIFVDDYLALSMNEEE